MKKYYFEAFASALVVGLGQILKGETEKGIILLLIFYLSIPAAVYFSLLINAYLFIFVLGISVFCSIILWIYNIREALLSP